MATSPLNRLARMVKREEREEAQRQPNMQEAKRIALINYARWSPGSSFRRGGERGGRDL
jgi:hypothetical protein